MGATVRMTSIGKEIESFIDSYEQDLSPKLYEALEALAADVDDMTEKLEDKVEDSKSEIEELKDKLSDIEYERDELENKSQRRINNDN